jgi:hypothetical protein
MTIISAVNLAHSGAMLTFSCFIHIVIGPK